MFTSAIATPWWPAHGVAELINRTAEVLPEAARRTLSALQRYDIAHKRKMAWATISAAATTAAGIGAVPIRAGRRRARSRRRHPDRPVRRRRAHLKRRFADAFQRVKTDDAGNQQPGVPA
ncbi:hypothetical protein O7632_30415 [Solwaraspora sp. WMMD406]|uniref:hypothetical protein n=1 Tax=Solwaraspora sp. WMMD406 TaxID=3016095 RepID=UPI002416438A|nr:hypothetical protein [Solwaraspora sp. WMMD406]MDG4768374.1 hypothetical protein [Solwaraspora sp. WMMD406]